MRSVRIRRNAVRGAAAVVLTAAVVTGTLVAATKSVTVTVDGASTEVSTLSGSVAGALSSAGLSVGEHDTLAPALDQPITDGGSVTLNRARLLTVTIDGSSRQLWTTARTVEAALEQLGEDTSRMELSADRSREIPLEGMDLRAQTVHSVTLADGGTAAEPMTSTGPTVGDVLAEKAVSIGDLDIVVPDSQTTIADGMAISITRKSISTVVEDEPIAQPADVTVDDADLDRGATSVTVQGAPGTSTVSYQVTTVDGAVTDKIETSRTVSLEPVATQVSVGTKSTLRWEGGEVFFDDTEFGVNWDGLAMCESTHNPQAVNGNPSAGLPTYGLFQFDIPTWQSVGGSGNPMDASPEEQIMRAKMLYQVRGLEPWVCAYAAH